jgi:hypothetical protein
MPYISYETKEELHFREPQNAGELNYTLTKIILDYLTSNSETNYIANYQRYNDAMGALEGCKLELYRRAIAPYEDKKIQENGDVY